MTLVGAANDNCLFRAGYRSATPLFRAVLAMSAVFNPCGIAASLPLTDSPDSQTRPADI